ncbi:MAG: hypothetical protein KatS3mg077_0670 [Candidatus Binatia bacterium]|nr:MAG: hypothetical protein KatS3mg077_0670 [Candidatus Binatia bacterium]
MWRRGVPLIALVCAYLGIGAKGACEQGDGLADQIVAAQRQALAAERAARIAERAAQKVADAVRAERRALWLERAAGELRQRGGREYLAARRGADLARRERNAVVDEARTRVRAALDAFDSLLETPAALERPAPALPPELTSLSERLAEHTERLRSAVLVAREALLQLQAVHTRLRLRRSDLTEAQARHVEETLARRQAALAEVLDRTVEAGETLARAAEDLHRASRVARSRARRVAEGPTRRRWGAGLGLAFNVDIGGKTRVETARIVEDPQSGARVVRVERTRTEVPRAALEVHYLFPLDVENSGPSAKSPEGELPRLATRARANGASNLALGPFVGVQFGDDFVDAVGAGLMLGWRVGALVPADQLQIGIGYFADPNTRVLGDGFSENRPPPAGETQVRYKDVTKSGVMILMTYGF